MHLYSVKLKKGIFASFFAVVLAYLFWPCIYDYFGEGAEVMKSSVKKSTIIRENCNKVGVMLIIPWGLSLDDSDRSGQLDIGYWFLCEGEIAKANGRFHHKGGGWLSDSISVQVKSRKYDLLDQSSIN